VTGAQLNEVDAKRVRSAPRLSLEPMTYRWSKFDATDTVLKEHVVEPAQATLPARKGGDQAGVACLVAVFDLSRFVDLIASSLNRPALILKLLGMEVLLTPGALVQLL